MSVQLFRANIRASSFEVKNWKGVERHRKLLKAMWKWQKDAESVQAFA